MVYNRYQNLQQASKDQNKKGNIRGEIFGNKQIRIKDLKCETPYKIPKEPA